MGKPPLRLLLVEDEPAHAAAIQHAFETGGAETQIEVVRTLEEFRRHSAGHPPESRPAGPEPAGWQSGGSPDQSARRLARFPSS